MPDLRKARPVSGEIMAAAPIRAAPSCPDPCFDFVDAEFETLDAREGKSGATAERYPAAMRPGQVSVPGMAVLRPYCSERALPGWARAQPPFWIAGAAAAAVAFWISGGHALFRQPSFSPDVTGGHMIVRVDRKAVNDGGSTLPMTALKTDVVSGDGGTTRYNLGTSGSPIGPGEKFAFASRLPVPTNRVKSVSVTFGE
jgi:hypothetical protein